MTRLRPVVQGPAGGDCAWAGPWRDRSAGSLGLQDPTRARTRNPGAGCRRTHGSRGLEALSGDQSQVPSVGPSSGPAGRAGSELCVSLCCCGTRVGERLGSTVPPAWEELTPLWVLLAGLAGLRAIAGRHYR